MLFVSLEMSAKEVMNRLVANMSGVEHDKIQKKLPLTEYERSSIEKAIEKTRNFNIYIYDKGSLTVNHLFNLGKKMAKEGKVDLIILDYLQLMDSGKQSQNDNSDVSYISRKLKQLAQEIHVPVIALSQMNRASIDGRTGKPREPQLVDLRSSGSIEQDANWVLMLHTEDQDGNYDRKFIKLFIRKNRSGAMGTIHMTFIGDTVHFEETEWDESSKKFIPVHQPLLEKEIEILDDDLPF